MTKPTLEVHTRYRYGKRSFIYPGDQFRASGGPFYVGTDDNGTRVRIPMGENGKYVFRRYCELGASKWIEASSEQSGTAIIYVGRARRSPRVDGLRLRPHTIRPVYVRRKKKRPVANMVQRTLFTLEEVEAS